MIHRCVAHTTILITCTIYARGPWARREVTFFTGRFIHVHVFASSKILGEGELSLCCKGALYSLKISVINDQIESS